MKQIRRKLTQVEVEKIWYGHCVEYGKIAWAQEPVDSWKRITGLRYGRIFANIFRDILVDLLYAP